MKEINSDLARQVKSLLVRLQETEDTEPDPQSRFDQCIDLCCQCIWDLQTKVIKDGFANEEEEITFFKYVKPVALSRFTYYHKRRELHLGQFNASLLIEQERLRKELTQLVGYLQANNSLLVYYRSGDTRHDRQYFLRGAFEWHRCPNPSQFNRTFSTACDEMLAELLANELIMEYLDERLQATSDPASTPPRKPAGTGLRCMAKVVDVSVLGEALYLVGFFGLTTKKDAMAHWGGLLQVDLSNHSQTISRQADSKDPCRFLQSLVDAFRKDMDDRVG